MSTDNVRVRKARADDLDAVKALADANKASLGFVLRPVLAAGIQRDWLLVAERAGQVIGFVHYRHRQDSQTTLYEICVDEASRRNGVGQSLVQALAIESQALGKAFIRLKSPTDLPANDFYRRLGFVLTDVQQGRRRQLNVWTTWLNGREGRV